MPWDAYFNLSYSFLVYSHIFPRSSQGICFCEQCLSFPRLPGCTPLWFISYLHHLLLPLLRNQAVPRNDFFHGQLLSFLNPWVHLYFFRKWYCLHVRFLISYSQSLLFVSLRDVYNEPSFRRPMFFLTSNVPFFFFCIHLHAFPNYWSDQLFSFLCSTWVLLTDHTYYGSNLHRLLWVTYLPSPIVSQGVRLQSGHFPPHAPLIIKWYVDRLSPFFYVLHARRQPSPSFLFGSDSTSASFFSQARGHLCLVSPEFGCKLAIFFFGSMPIISPILLTHIVCHYSEAIFFNTPCATPIPRQAEFCCCISYPTCLFFVLLISRLHQCLRGGFLGRCFL